ncbi:hypothetical protein RCL1_006618 [Eukaryota sp. TZLM3-RCL]
MIRRLKCLLQFNSVSVGVINAMYYIIFLLLALVHSVSVSSSCLYNQNSCSPQLHFETFLSDSPITHSIDSFYDDLNQTYALLHPLNISLSFPSQNFTLPLLPMFSFYDQSEDFVFHDNECIGSGVCCLDQFSGRYFSRRLVQNSEFQAFSFDFSKLESPMIDIKITHSSDISFSISPTNHFIQLNSLSTLFDSGFNNLSELIQKLSLFYLITNSSDLSSYQLVPIKYFGSEINQIGVSKFSFEFSTKCQDPINFSTFIDTIEESNQLSSFNQIIDTLIGASFCEFSHNQVSCQLNKLLPEFISINFHLNYFKYYPLNELIPPSILNIGFYSGLLFIDVLNNLNFSVEIFARPIKLCIEEGTLCMLTRDLSQSIIFDSQEVKRFLFHFNSEIPELFDLSFDLSILQSNFSYSYQNIPSKFSLDPECFVSDSCTLDTIQIFVENISFCCPQCPGDLVYSEMGQCVNNCTENYFLNSSLLCVPINFDCPPNSVFSQLLGTCLTIYYEKIEHIIGEIEENSNIQQKYCGPFAFLDGNTCNCFDFAELNSDFTCHYEQSNLIEKDPFPFDYWSLFVTCILIIIISITIFITAKNLFLKIKSKNIQQYTLIRSTVPIITPKIKNSQSKILECINFN